MHNIEVILHLGAVCTLSILYIQKEEEHYLTDLIKEIESVGFIPFDLELLPIETIEVKKSVCFQIYEISRKFLEDGLNVETN